MGRTSFNAVLLANLPKSRKEKKRFFKDTTFFKCLLQVFCVETCIRIAC